MSSFVRFVRALRNAMFGVPHRHQWEEAYKPQEVFSFGNKIGYRFILRCKNCGEVTSRDCV